MGISPLERFRLGAVRPELLDDLTELMAAAGAQLGYTLAVPTDGGARTIERQTELYNASLAAGGGQLAYPVGRPGYSRHNYGAAFDVDIIAGGANADGTGSDADYAKLAQLAESLPGSPGLTAGYYFAARGQGTMSDPFHFQLNETLASSQQLAGTVVPFVQAAGVGLLIVAIAAGLWLFARPAR